MKSKIFFPLIRAIRDEQLTLLVLLAGFLKPKEIITSTDQLN